MSKTDTGQSELRQKKRRIATSRPVAFRVGVFVDHHSQYGRDVLRGIARYANAVGPWVLHVPPGWYIRPYPGIADWSGDGVIAQVQSTPFASHLAGRLGLPVVDVNGSIPGLPFAQVVVDNRAVGVTGAKKLLSLGHQHFGFVGDARLVFSEERHEGFARTILESRADATCSHADQNATDLLRWAIDLPKPAAVLFMNDDSARGFLSLVHGHVRVPEELSVLGVDDDAVQVELASPRLSSIALPVERIGHEAARILHEMMEHPDRTPRRATRVMFPPLTVQDRASTEVAVPDALVAEAQHQIRALVARSDLSVVSLAEILAVSRRTLERRFRLTLNRAVLSEIHRVRIDRAQGLLTHTTFPMPHVARQCGFKSLRRFTIAFHRTTGITPGKFRRSQRHQT